MEYGIQESLSSVCPIWKKYVLTIEEAAVYFRIGIHKLRQITEENQNADFILIIGNRRLIKRKKFEEYVDKLNVI